MKHQPTLLFINGPAGTGKSTLAQRYIDEHPLALQISGDDIIAAMGQWLTHEPEGRQLVFALVKVMAAQHLGAGYDVVIPYLLVHEQEAVALEEIARTHNAIYREVALVVSKEEAVRRLFERGSWGEPGAPLLTQQDTPVAQELFDQFQITLDRRTQAKHIYPRSGDIDGTYRLLLEAIQSSTE